MPNLLIIMAQTNSSIIVKIIFFLTLYLGEVYKCGVTMSERCARVCSAHMCALGLHFSDCYPLIQFL